MVVQYMNDGMAGGFLLDSHIKINETVRIYQLKIRNSSVSNANLINI